MIDAGKVLLFCFVLFCLTCHYDSLSAVCAVVYTQWENLFLQHRSVTQLPVSATEGAPWFWKQEESHNRNRFR